MRARARVRVKVSDGNRMRVREWVKVQARSSGVKQCTSS
jgi:hypothetical protein